MRSKLGEIGAALVVLLIAYAAGYFEGAGQVRTVTVEHVVEKQGDTQVVYRDHIITVTKEVDPDGKEITTTKTEQVAEHEDQKTEESVEDKKTEVTPAEKNYSLGLLYNARLGDLLPGPSRVELDGGRRLLGPIWLDLHVVPVEREAAIGFRVEF